MCTGFELSTLNCNHWIWYSAWFKLNFEYQQFFGQNVLNKSKIIQADDSIDEDVVANYCYMYSEFQVPDNYKVGFLFQLFLIE